MLFFFSMLLLVIGIWLWVDNSLCNGDYQYMGLAGIAAAAALLFLLPAMRQPKVHCPTDSVPVSTDPEE
jgi:surface polysaccharide O-acyltransferase-like enzyme